MKIPGLGYFFATKPMIASISTSHFTISRARPKGVISSTSEIWSELHENHRIRVFFKKNLMVATIATSGFTLSRARSN